MVLTAYIVISPAIGLSCHRRLRKSLPANLTPASRRQDHTILPSASKALSSEASLAATASNPASVTIAIRPSSGVAGELMRRRSAIVEHPFGTLKCRAGYQHFLVRGFDKVRGEWSLMALCYNFTRVVNILGFERFATYMTEKVRVARESSLASPLSSIPLVLQTFQANIALWLAVATLRATPAP